MAVMLYKFIGFETITHPAIHSCWANIKKITFAQQDVPDGSNSLLFERLVGGVTHSDMWLRNHDS